MVHYQGTKFHSRLGIDHQLPTPIDFLALLIPHVLLRYEVTIRTYGALSTTFRKKLGWIENPPTNEPPPECVAELRPLPGAKPAPEVSALLPDDPRVHRQGGGDRRRGRRGRRVSAHAATQLGAVDSQSLAGGSFSLP